LNWAGFCQPINELDQTAIHPALSPPLASLFGKKIWQEILVVLASPRGKPAKIVAKKVGRLWSDVREEVWFGSFFQRLIVF
jgi:hypothetical protein